MTSVSTPTPSLSLATVPLWIDGGPCGVHTVLFGHVMNPTKGEAIRRVPLTDEADVDRGVRSAAAAFPEWRATTPLRRSRILTRFRELLAAHHAELASLISEEHGKVFQDAMGSVQRGIEVVEFAAGAPHLSKGEFAESVGRDVDASSRRQPLGVCVGIAPFNFPAMVPLWMFPVALVCGNTFVLKPSERDPSASVRMAELLKEASVPDGVLNVVHGDKNAVDALLNHPDVKAVSFVGSMPVARYVYMSCAKASKRVQALGGAKNHAVVLPDADVDFAAEAVVGAARSIGLFGLVELVRNRGTREPLAPFNGTSAEMSALNKAFREEGLYTFVRWNTFFTNPPLSITERELRDGFAMIDRALAVTDRAVQ